MRPPFKTHGGKFYLHKWIISHFPENYQELSYIEPFSGGASVLLNKTPSKEEILNDLDTSTVTLLRILRDQSEEFLERIRKIKYKKSSFEAALEAKQHDTEIEFAINEFVLRRMSRGGTKKAFAWSDRLRGGQPGELNAWKTIIASLPEIITRLQDVYIFNKNAKEILKTFDAKDVLFYCDPPYLPETRESPNIYSCEMSMDDHIELGELLNNIKGKVLLSGYPSRLYNKLYKGWNCEKKNIANHASQKKIKPIKTELLWKNF